MSNPHPPTKYQFKKGNPGRLPGTKNKTTILKEKLLDAAIKIDLSGSRIVLLRDGRRVAIPNMRPDDLVRVAASLIPKEQLIKGEGFETNISLTNVLNSEEVDPEARRGLIEILRKKRSPGQSV